MAETKGTLKRDRLYTEEDADLGLIKDRKIAVLGYGSQGHAQAQNMRDQGLDVIVGNVEDRFAEQARSDGFEVVPIAEAVQRGRVILMLIPDEVQPAVYKSDIEPHLTREHTLVFASGYAVHFGLITPPGFLDVIMAVPTCVGAIVRERYARGQGIFGHFGIHQDVTGQAHDLALAVAMGIGILRFGATKTTFGEEVAINLFAETAGLSGMIKYLLTAFEVLIEAGFSAEKAYCETFYEIQFLVETICRMPLGKAVAFGSPTATYLALTKTGDVVTDDVRERMRQMLARIQAGEMVRDWNLEQLAGCPVLNQRKREILEHPISEVEKLFMERKLASGGI